MILTITPEDVIKAVEDRAKNYTSDPTYTLCQRCVVAVAAQRQFNNPGINVNFTHIHDRTGLLYEVPYKLMLVMIGWDNKEESANIEILGDWELKSAIPEV